MSDESIDPKDASTLHLCARHRNIVQQMCPDESIGGAHVYRLFVERGMLRAELDGAPWHSVPKLVAWCQLLSEGCPICFDIDPDDMLARIRQSYKITGRSLIEWRERVTAWHVQWLDHLRGAKGRVWLVKIGVCAEQVKATPESIGTNSGWWN